MEDENIDESNADAVRAYISALSMEANNNINLSNFGEAYQGEFLSDEDFARYIADETGETIAERWPYYCIDWERAAKELMMDYYEADGHYFRSM